jgi:hypothetical protein
MHNYWLFIRNVLAHWVAAMSGIVSLALGIVEYFRKRQTEAKLFAVVACVFLMPAFYQAWQDEHHNSEILIAEKSTAVSERDFWRQQAYRKDDALRSRDQLLAQNYTALIGEQGTANKAQDSLAQLSGKILDIDKPAPLRVITQSLAEPSGDGSIKVRYFIVLTNKTVNPAIMNVVCDQDISAGEGAVVGAKQEMMGIGPVVAKRRFNLSITSPPWSPLSPILLDVHYSGPEPNCGIEGVAE